MINVDKVSKFYVDFKAVSDVSFRIESGEIVGLLGHNGAGKTTIMKILSGVFEPDSGSVTINGLDLVKDRAQCQASVGYLPENVPLYNDMLVGSYLEMLFKLRSENPDQFSNRLQYVVEATDIKSKISDRISTLSKGYRQRVGLAGALINTPKVLILDEPTNGLDPSQIKDMRELIVEFSKNATVILSTHIMQEVTAICDRAIVINSGKIELDKSLSEISNDGKFKFSILLDGEFSGLETLEEVRKVAFNLPEIESVELYKEKTTSEMHEFMIGIKLDSNMNQAVAGLNNILVSKGFNVSGVTKDNRSLESIFSS